MLSGKGVTEQQKEERESSKLSFVPGAVNGIIESSLKKGVLAMF